MPNISYIHSADLHLDAPFKGLTKHLLHGERLGQQLKEATFAAVDRLEQLCLETRPDFLVLAGDLTNSEEQSIRARLRLVRLCTNLQKANIQVFIIHGNHDPKSQTFKSITFPDNVVIFGEDVTSVPLSKDGEVLALIHGVSHMVRLENRAMCANFKRDPKYDNCFQLGLCHCTIGGGSDQTIQPTSLADLKAANLDAWALGHIHRPQIVAQDPLIVYAGSPQGLDISEDGPHGCYLVRASLDDGQWVTTTTFYPLAPIIWQTLSLDLSDLTTIEQVVIALENELTRLKDNLPANVRASLVKVSLTCHTSLAQELSIGIDDLQAELIPLEQGTPGIYLLDLAIQADQAVDLTNYLERDDLLGFCVRKAQDLPQDAAESFIQKTLSPLFNQSQLRKILGSLDQTTCQDLLADATKLCIAQLEEQGVH